MKVEQFNLTVERQIERVRDVLCVKGAEYATEDKLHNFRVAANLQNCSMEQALGGFMAKHTVSIYDMIESQKVYSIEQWDEKITDHINYLILLRAILEERFIENEKGVKVNTLSESMDECTKKTNCNNGLFTLEEIAQKMNDITRSYSGISQEEYSKRHAKKFNVNNNKVFDTKEQMRVVILSEDEGLLNAFKRKIRNFERACFKL